MCFKIDHKAKRPKTRTGYKVVTLRTDGYLYSYLNPNKAGGRLWSYPGRTVRRSKGEVASYGMTRWDRVLRGRKNFSLNGIYVYLNRQDAVEFARGEPHLVVIAVALDPEDWIHSGFRNCTRHGRVATYEKVVVKERQPFFEYEAAA